MYRQPPQWKPRQPCRMAAKQERLSLERPARLVSADTTTDFRDRDNFDEVADIARKSYKLVKEVMGELNVEYKVITANKLGLLPDWSGATTDSNVLANFCTEGVTDGTRTGTSIKISNFFIAGHIMLNNPSPAANDIVFLRCIVYWQKGIDHVTKVFPSFAAVSGVSTDGILEFEQKGTILAPHAAKDFSNDSATKILWDKTWTIDNTWFGHHFRKLIRVNQHTEFADNTDTIATGALRVMWVSNIANSVTTRPKVDYLLRTYFVDN